MSRRVRPVLFRIPADTPGGLYVLVRVWPTKRAFLASRRRVRDTGIGHRVDGTCKDILVRRYRRGKYERTLAIFAEVDLWRGRLTMENVTHELFHATIAWGRRMLFNWSRLQAEDSVNEDEERLTYVHGRLCRRFMVRAIDLGLYGDQEMVTVQ